MNTYPADEQWISEVERGFRRQAIVPLPCGETISAGDCVLFALSLSRPGEPTSYVSRGDSVQVCLTDVTNLGTIDPASAQPLVQLTWKPPGQTNPLVSVARRRVKARSRTHG